MKVTHNNIKDFLYTPNKYFVIPDFQRPYSWEKDNVQSFLNDLSALAETQNTNHFFGSIVYINEGDNSVIIDGQQRATTVLLMLTALYHLVAEDSGRANMPADQIKESYLYNKFAERYGSEENRIKLRTVTTDNEIFENIFEQSELNDTQKASRIHIAYKYFYEYFKDKNELDQYIDVLQRFEVVTIALDATDDNPQKVFESINSTGKPLSDGDKIRNFALMLNNDEVRKYVLNNYWKQIEVSLTDATNDYITDFFRNYLISKYQRDVKLRDVYPTFKQSFYEAIEDEDASIEELKVFYDDIVSKLSHYQYLKFNRDVASKYGQLGDAGFRINYLQIEVSYPFLMNVLEMFVNGTIDSKRARDIMHMIESMLTRRIISGIASTGLNNLFSTLHKDVMKHLTKYPDETYENVLAYILIEKAGGLRYPVRSEVDISIRNNPFYEQRSYYNLFVLTSIDDMNQSKESSLLRQVSDGSLELTIEHVMPQTLTDAWKKRLGTNYQTIHDSFVHTLPNLTLTGYNSKYSNRDFTEKKTIENGFNNSPLLINRFIAEKNTWTDAELTERSDWWSLQIDKIWPVPLTTFVPESNDVELSLLDEVDLTYTKPKQVTILGESYQINSWKEALPHIFEVLFTKYREEIPSLLDKDEFVGRYIRSKKDANSLISYQVIPGTDYVVEANTSSNYKRMLVAKVGQYLGLSNDDIKVVIAKNSEKD